MSEENTQGTEQEDVKDNSGPQPPPVQNLIERVPGYLLADAIRKIREMESIIKHLNVSLAESNKLHDVKNANLSALENEYYKLQMSLTTKTENK